MRVQLAQQVQEILGKSALVIITERVDDVALLIGQRVKRGFGEVLDRPSPRHWQQRERSWGWTAVLWRAYLLTEGHHRKVSTEADVKGMHNTLSHLSGQGIAPRDFRDDRWGHLLQHVSQPTSWHASERDLHERSLEVDAWSQDVIRCDATTASGHHAVTERGVCPCGQRKDEPTRPQIKVMMGSWDPVGMPLSTEVLSGERADEGLDMPIMERMRRGLNKTGRLLVGDGTMSALETRTPVVGHHAFSLSPLPCIGAPAAAMAAWSAAGVTQDKAGELERMFRINDRGQEVLVAEG